MGRYERWLAERNNEIPDGVQRSAHEIKDDSERDTIKYVTAIRCGS